MKKPSNYSIKIKKKLNKSNSFEEVIPKGINIRHKGSEDNFHLTQFFQNDEYDSNGSRKPKYLKQNVKKINPKVLKRKIKHKLQSIKKMEERDKLKGWEVEEEPAHF